MYVDLLNNEKGEKRIEKKSAKSGLLFRNFVAGHQNLLSQILFLTYAWAGYFLRLGIMMTLSSAVTSDWIRLASLSAATVVLYFFAISQSSSPL